MVVRLDAGFPSTPLTDPASGEVTPAWRGLLQTLWARTGQTTAPAIGVGIGALNAELQALLALGGLPSVTLTLGASPYAYTPPSTGAVYVSGGGVTAMTVRRGTGAAWPVGQFYGGHPVTAHDVLTVSYVVAPVMVFFPG